MNRRQQIRPYISFDATPHARRGLVLGVYGDDIMTQHCDVKMLECYIVGDVTDDEAAELECHLLFCPTCAHSTAELQHYVRLTKEAFYARGERSHRDAELCQPRVSRLHHICARRLTLPLSAAAVLVVTIFLFVRTYSTLRMEDELVRSSIAVKQTQMDASLYASQALTNQLVPGAVNRSSISSARTEVRMARKVRRTAKGAVELKWQGPRKPYVPVNPRPVYVARLNSLPLPPDVFIPIANRNVRMVEIACPPPRAKKRSKVIRFITFSASRLGGAYKLLAKCFRREEFGASRFPDNSSVAN
jgi:hypothetical protein